MKQEKDGLLQLELLKVVAEQQQENFLEYDVETDTASILRLVNGQFVEQEVLRDYCANEEVSFSRLAEEDRAAYKKLLQKCIKTPRRAALDLRMVNPKGEKIWYRLFIISIADENRKVKKITGRFLPIHKEKIANDMIRLQAERDSLSNVYNHKTYELLAEELIQKNPDDVLFAMIDIDDFKRINDTCGHFIGDRIIKELGGILEEAVEDIGYAGRMGGDEFSVCICGADCCEKAIAFCMRIKDATKGGVEGVTYTLSIGASRSNKRNVSFMDLYHEADEAVYFAKKSGKNQIVLAEELGHRRQLLIEENAQEGELTEEEATLDLYSEYIAIIEPDTKKIQYMNKSARKALGLSLRDAKKLCCYELFQGKCSECEVCDLFATYVRVLDEESECGLAKYIPDGRFIIQSRYTAWKQKPARRIAFLNVNDKKHVEECLVHEINSQDTVNKCWNVMLDASMQDTDYVRMLEIMNNYYDADCTAIVTKVDGVYSEIFEYHRDIAEKVAEGLAYGRDHGKLDEFEVLINEEGLMLPHYIEKALKNHPEIAKALEGLYVRNTLGMRLMRMNEFVGVLLVVNPRHYVNDVNLLKRVGVFFSTDLLRRRLIHEREYGDTHDLLTRFWNREFFAEWGNRYNYLFNGNFGVFTTDILRLRDINREFGYEHGNRRLLEVARVYRNVFSGYSIFRFDDDQMVAVCHRVDNESFQKLVNCAKELISELGFDVACGYAWTREGIPVQLIKQAEEVMALDKKRLEKEHTIHQSNEYIESDIISEIQKGNFRVYLQPKVDIYSEKTVGAEALIRLWEDKRGLVPPGYFIPILEERHVIHMIDLFVLRDVMRFQKEVIEKGETPVRISVNFSKNTLMFKGLLDYIKGLCEEFELPKDLIQIEITESISSMDHMVVNNIAKSLRNMGFSISMDDFGTQYSNMSMLTQFQFDAIKIDRSMVIDIEKKPENVTILKHVLGMLKELKLSAVIEGVESREQLEILKKLGCDVVQGFYFGRPEPKEQFYELFMK